MSKQSTSSPASRIWPATSAWASASSPIGLGIRTSACRTSRYAGSRRSIASRTRDSAVGDITLHLRVGGRDQADARHDEPIIERHTAKVVRQDHFVVVVFGHADHDGKRTGLRDVKLNGPFVVMDEAEGDAALLDRSLGHDEAALAQTPRLHLD